MQVEVHGHKRCLIKLFILFHTLFIENRYNNTVNSYETT